MLLRYQKGFKEIPEFIINFLIHFVELIKNFFIILVKSEFNKFGTDSLGIHWSQYLALTLSSLLIFFISLYKTIPNFKSFILQVIWFLNCSGLNCNGA